MNPILVLMGPTAVGKTSYGIARALELNGEIISADSRQIFKELTIGTAKPSAEELATVPHHFINELSLNESFSAGKFAQQAKERISEILSRGKNPIVVGGSTLYLRALMEGIAPIPEIEPHFRESISKELAEQGATRLYESLQQFDPQYAKTLDPTKTQRLIRGHEVYRATGKPISYFHSLQVSPPFSFQPLVLMRPRNLLYERINARVDLMLKEGLIEEVQEVLKKGFSPNINALQTIGYQEPIAYFNGQIDMAEMIRLIKRNTRRYAKRQITWFRKYEQQML